MPTPKYRGLKSPPSEKASDESVTPEQTTSEVVVADQETAPVKTSPSKKKEKMYTVKFHSQEGPGGKDDIVIHLGNAKDIGRNWRIKREAEVTIPESAMRVIMNAKITAYEVDEHTKKPIVSERDRFAYTVIRAE